MIQLFRFSAVCVAYQGVFLIIELALPSRNFIGIYIWWQYIRMRYMIESQTAGKSSDRDMLQAMVSIDERIESILSMR